MSRLLCRNLAMALVCLSACAGAAKQEDARGVAPLESGGRVVELSGVSGKFPKIDSVSLYFYPGQFEIPLHGESGGKYRGNVSAAQVNGMARQKHGFRVYRCKLTVVSRSDSGQTDSQTQDLTIALEP